MSVCHDTHDVSRRDVSRASWRACRAVLVPTWRTTKKQPSARVYKFSLCALDLRQSQEQLLEKRGGHVHPSPLCGDVPNTRVIRVALFVTSVSHRAARQAPHSTSRLFPVAKCMARYDLYCVGWGVKLYSLTQRVVSW